MYLVILTLKSYSSIDYGYIVDECLKEELGIIFLMQKIVPHLWFDSKAEEAVSYYTSIFGNSKTGFIRRYGKAGQEIHKQKEGSVMTIDFEIEGFRFVALNGGPVFKFTPAISFFVRCGSEKEIDYLYEKLSDGGNALMSLSKYPFAEKFAWVEDRYGVTWQLILGDVGNQKIVPCMMFVGRVSGKAEEAMNLYMSAFKGSKIGSVEKYKSGEDPEVEGTIKRANLWLADEEFVVMDSNHKHEFSFTEAISLMVRCETQAELDYYWGKLTADPHAEQCGWLKDRFGVSWQIVPTILEKMFETLDEDKSDKLMDAVLKMKKLDILQIERSVI